MTNRERFFVALNHRQPDKTPYNILFTQKAREKMVEYYKDPNFEKKLGNCFTIVDFDGFDRCKEVRPNIYEDWFGVQWDRTVDKDIGVVCNRLVTEDNLDEFQFPDPNGKELYEGKEEVIKSAGDTILLGNYGFTTFERAWTLMGMEDLLVAMAVNKPFAHELFDRILDYNLKVVENVCKYDIDGIRFGDDWGQQMGIIMGPQLWREFIKPRVKKLFQYVKSKGKFVLIHCCGKVQEIFPDIIECGVDIFNPFQPEVMDVFEIKKMYGDRLTFYGGVSIQQTLPFGTVDQVKEEVKALIEKVGKGGGYIASPSHDVPADAKPENIAAMIEVLQNQ